MTTKTIKVAGVTFSNEDGVDRQTLLGVIYDDYWTEDREGEVVFELRPEPDNTFDPDAIGVWVVAPKAVAGRVGFVPAEETGWVGCALRARRVAGVEIDDMGVRRGGRVHVRLALVLRDGKPTRRRRPARREPPDPDTYTDYLLD